MNENHNHDKALEDAIERVVHGKKASGNELLDMLGSAKPQADPTFMANLEERLMAEFSSKEKETMMLKRKERPNKFGRWPLTMAAAILAIILVGGLLLYMQQKPMEVAANPNATATDMPMITVVMAIEDIPEGTQITADMVALFLSPVENTPSDAAMSIDAVVGSYARTTIYPEEIILARKISERSPISMTATAQARGGQEISNLNPSNTVPVIYNAPEKQGCDAGTSLQVPANGQVVNSPIVVRGMAQHNDFAQAKIEISGPSTNNEWVVIANVTQEVATTSDFGQFVPSLYESGTYQFRLETFSSLANLVAYCTITIYISDETAGANLVPVVIAIQDIPAGTEITPDRVATIMMPAENAPQSAMTSLQDVVGQYAFADIYREEIILARKITSDPVPQFVTREGLTLNIIVGHQGNNDVGATCPDGRSELEINQRVADELSSRLIEWGYAVNLLDERASNTSNADFTIMLHTGTCNSEDDPSYRLISPEADYMANLSECFNDNYSNTTGQRRIMPNAPLEGFSQETPIVLLEMNVLYTERDLSPVEFDEIGSGLAMTVSCFMHGQGDQTITYQRDFLPVVIALQDIPMNTLITQDMLSQVYWPQDVATEYASAHTGQWFNTQIDEIVGKQSRTFIPALSPISDDWYGTPSGCTPEMIMSADSRCWSLPSGYVSVILETDDLSMANFQIGEYVDIVAPLNGSGQQGKLGRIGLNAIVLYTEVFHEGQPESVMVMLGLSAADADTLMFVDDAHIPYILVPHLEGAETSPIATATIPTEAPVAEDEITAYYPIAEDFVGDYDAIATDSRALFVAVMPANTDEALLAGVPLYTTGDGLKVLVFEVSPQIGAYTYTREDGSMETGRSARLLLSTREANWLEQLRLAGVRYQYTLIPLNRMDIGEIAPIYPASENGLVLISIPTTSIALFQTLDANDRVEIQIRPINDSPLMLPIVDANGMLTWLSRSEAVNLIRIPHIARVVGASSDSDGSLPLPHAQYEAGSLFVTLEVNPEDAWLIDWYLNYGSEFGLVEQ